METKNLPATQQQTGIAGLLSQDAVKKRFDSVLGKKAPGFMSSIISAVSTNSELKKADPVTVVSAAAVAASLDLPINPSLGFAHIVPYGGKAQFQMGWRGYVQLGMRSGQYKTINVSVVYEGELVGGNRFTGEMIFDESKRTSDKIIGYVAYFKLLNGFEKYLYMTEEQATAHGKKYSKSYNNSASMWQKDPAPMKLKTVLKMLLSKFGILSVEMQNAVVYDQAVVKTIEGEYEYVDNHENEGEFIEAGQADQDAAATLKTFDENIPSDIDKDILAEFLTRTAESNKTTVDEVKIESAKDFDNFLKIIYAYQKQQRKKKPAKKAGAEVMAKAPCPDSPENTYSAAHCDKCEKRPGCPAWN